MHIEQMYTNCLAEAAYYIESEGEAAIIDPIRETEPYLAKAKERGVRIKYVFETHFHADFVSGHLDLARKTGAKIIYGPGAETRYEVHNAKDGEEFSVGKIRIRAIHTPGHTPESTCYLLIDDSGKEHSIFTGDTLFVGDVGRPDLLDGKMSKEELAGMMYDSLHNKLKPLADDIIVYPAHGPGSACGKNIGKETWSTMGQQKQTNYALQDMPKDEFISILTSGLSAPPQYFYKDAMINKNGYDNIETVMQRNTKALSVEDVKKELAAGALILDTRIPDNFEKGFIKGSLNIGLNGTFAVWVGTIVDINQPLVLVTDEGKEEESVLRLARVGYENVKGFLKGGVEAWKASGGKLDTVSSLTPEEFARRVGEGKEKIVDVRKPGEFEAGHVKNALNLSLAELEKSAGNLDRSATYLVHCAGGYRSMIAASILKAHGIDHIYNIYGGFSKIKDTGVEVVAPEHA